MFRASACVFTPLLWSNRPVMMLARDGQQLGLVACASGYSTALVGLSHPVAPYVFGMYWARRAISSGRSSSFTRSRTLGRPAVAASATLLPPWGNVTPTVRSIIVTRTRWTLFMLYFP